MSPHTSSHSWGSLPSSLLSLSALSSLLLTLSSPTAAYDCNQISASSVTFKLGELAGPHLIHWEEPVDYQHGVQYKHNFTLDICGTLKWHKGATRKTECQHGTWICDLREEHHLSDPSNATIEPVEIAGNYPSHNGRKMDEQFELLRNSKSHSDAQREGLRAEFHGGRYPFDDKNGQEQRAIIEFVCDKDRTGLEGDEKDDGEREKEDPKEDPKDDKEGGDKSKDEKKEGEKLRKREDETPEKTDKCGETDRSLCFRSYDLEDADKGKKAQTLRLEWKTKYACENAPRDSSDSSWGFFTWFIIILFMAIAAYLIFGSWLNYNRYGARGWDLLPHGDTIRDIPYILKDCARRVKDTVQGGGSRGGYAAV